MGTTDTRRALARLPAPRLTQRAMTSKAEADQPPGSSAILAALATAVVSSGILLLFSELLRIASSELRYRVFAPRVTRRLQARHEAGGALAARRSELVAMQPGRTPLSWLAPALRVRDDDLLPEVGLDATLFVKFTRLVRQR